MKIYDYCPVFEDENYMIRLFRDEDCDDLLKVYSDKNALPFFNSDNCDGDNFYYATRERMAEAISFWHMSYENGWFARLSIVDKSTEEVIGTVELCLRVSDDAFNNMGILRVDVRSDYEKADVLYDIFKLTTHRTNELLGGKGVITKVPIYAVERLKAIQKAGYTKSDHLLIGKNGYAYDSYYTYQEGEIMSKYDSLWKWISEKGQDDIKLTYAQIEEIAGVPIDHSFLKYKKEFESIEFTRLEIPRDYLLKYGGLDKLNL